jgi:hypothetical protein
VVRGAEASGTWARIVYHEEVSPIFISTYASTPRAAGRTHGQGGEDSFGTARGWGHRPPYETTKAFRRALGIRSGIRKSRGPGEGRGSSLASSIMQAFFIFRRSRRLMMYSRAGRRR